MRVPTSALHSFPPCVRRGLRLNRSRWSSSSASLLTPPFTVFTFKFPQNRLKPYTTERNNNINNILYYKRIKKKKRKRVLRKRNDGQSRIRLSPSHFIEYAYVLSALSTGLSAPTRKVENVYGKNVFR